MAEVAAKIQQIAQDVFQHAYVRAMHPTLVLPVAAAFVGRAVPAGHPAHDRREAGDPTAAPTAEAAAATPG